MGTEAELILVTTCWDGEQHVAPSSEVQLVLAALLVQRLGVEINSTPKAELRDRCIALERQLPLPHGTISVPLSKEESAALLLEGVLELWECFGEEPIAGNASLFLGRKLAIICQEEGGRKSCP